MKNQTKLTETIRTQNQLRRRTVKRLCEECLNELFCVEVVGGEQEYRDFETHTQAGREGDYYALICN